HRRSPLAPTYGSQQAVYSESSITFANSNPDHSSADCCSRLSASSPQFSTRLGMEMLKSKVATALKGKECFELELTLVEPLPTYSHGMSPQVRTNGLEPPRS